MDISIFPPCMYCCNKIFSSSFYSNNNTLISLILTEPSLREKKPSVVAALTAPELMYYRGTVP